MASSAASDSAKPDGGGAAMQLSQMFCMPIVDAISGSLSCFAVEDSQVYVGTSEGALFQYKISMGYDGVVTELCAEVDTTATRECDPPRIEAVIPMHDIGLVAVLYGGNVALHDKDTLEENVLLPVKGCSAICRDTTCNEAPGVLYCVTTKSTALISLKTFKQVKEFKKAGGVTNPMHIEPGILVAKGGAYHYVKGRNGDTKRVARTSVGVTPVMTPIIEREVLVSLGTEGKFVDYKRGTQKRPSFTWNQPPVGLACVYPMVYALLGQCLEVTDINEGGASQTIPVPECILMEASDKRVFIASQTQILAVVAATEDDWLPAAGRKESHECSSTPLPVDVRPSAVVLTPSSPGNMSYETMVFLPGGDTVKCTVENEMTADQLLTAVLAKCDGKSIASASKDAYVLKVSGRLDNFHGDRYLWDGNGTVADHECIQYCATGLPVAVRPKFALLNREQEHKKSTLAKQQAHSVLMQRLVGRVIVQTDEIRGFKRALRRDIIDEIMVARQSEQRISTLLRQLPLSPISVLPMAATPLRVQMSFPGASGTKVILCTGNELPTEIIRTAASKFSKHFADVAENSAENVFLLKTIGLDEYLYAQVPLRAYEFVQTKASKGAKIPFSLVEISSLGLPNKEEDQSLAMADNIIDDSGDTHAHVHIHEAEEDWDSMECISLWDVTSPFRVRIYGVDNIGGANFDELLSREGAEANPGTLSIEVGLFYGDQLRCKPRNTCEMGMASYVVWSQWLEFDVHTRYIPWGARLCFTVYHTSGRSGEPRTPIGWVNLPVLDFKDCLRTGIISLKLWPDDSADPIGTSVDNAGGKSTLYIELDKFPLPVAYPFGGGIGMEVTTTPWSADDIEANMALIQQRESEAAAALEPIAPLSTSGRVSIAGRGSDRNRRSFYKASRTTEAESMGQRSTMAATYSASSGVLDYPESPPLRFRAPTISMDDIDKAIGAGGSKLHVDHSAHKHDDNGPCVLEEPQPPPAPEQPTVERRHFDAMKLLAADAANVTLFHKVGANRLKPNFQWTVGVSLGFMTVAESHGWKLQLHKFTRFTRLISDANIRVAWTTSLASMLQILEETLEACKYPNGRQGMAERQTMIEKLRATKTSSDASLSPTSASIDVVATAAESIADSAADAEEACAAPSVTTEVAPEPAAAAVAAAEEQAAAGAEPAAAAKPTRVSRARSRHVAEPVDLAALQSSQQRGNADTIDETSTNANDGAAADDVVSATEGVRNMPVTSEGVVSVSSAGADDFQDISVADGFSASGGGYGEGIDDEDGMVAFSSDEVLQEMEAVIAKDALFTLTEDERKSLWRHRWCLTQKSKALAKVLQSVPENNLRADEDVLGLLAAWKKPSPEDVLELLDAKFPDRRIREYAVQQLETLPDVEIGDYLLQLVQVLKYEPFHDNALAHFLIQRALANPFRVGHSLYWLLRAEVHVAEISERYGVLIQEYVSYCGVHQKRLVAENEALKTLLSAAYFIKTVPPTSREDRMTALHGKLNELKLPPKFTLPLNASIQCSGLIVEKCKYMDSAKLPLWLCLRNADPEGDPFLVMLKAGDDLRQDQLCLQMIQIMDNLWKKSGLDLRMTAYGCTATGDMEGLIDVVRDSETTSNIMIEMGGASAAFKDSVLADWLRKHNPTTESFELAVDNFIRSCAGYCVASYILGLGDRHNDNTMLTRSGKFLHIDFGHFLGHVKTFMGFNRDKAPFVFTREMVYVMGGTTSNLWSSSTKVSPNAPPEFKKFVEFACDAFLVLRRNHNLFINLFAMMISTGMPELRTTDNVVYVREMFMPTLTEDEARLEFVRLIHISLHTLMTRLNNYVHNLAHSSRT